MANGSMPINVRNWIGETRKLGLPARGLLIEIMCHARTEPDREIPPPPGKSIMDAASLALLCSAGEVNVSAALQELQEAGLISYTLTGHLTCRLLERHRKPQNYASPAEQALYQQTAEAIYKAWPRPGDRAGSVKAVVRLLSTRTIDHDELQRRAERYIAAQQGRDPQFVKKLVRWINQEIYEEWAEKDARTGSANDHFNKMWSEAK